MITTTLITFLPSLWNGFVWDDQINIVENPRFRGFSLSNLKWMFTTLAGGPYQPLTWMSYAINFLLGGMNPFGYHLANVFIHAVNAGLVYTLSLRFQPKNESPEWSPAIFSAAFAALFFSIHPLRVESVAWITERRDVLSGFFFLLTLLMYQRYGVEPERKRRYFWYAFAMFLMSLLSKGIAITLPLVLVILDVYSLGRLPVAISEWSSKQYRKVWREKAIFLLPAIFFGVVGLIGQAQFGALATLGSLSILDRLAIAFYGISFYLIKTVAPTGLSPLYEMPEPLSSLYAEFSAAFVLVTVITGVLINRAKSSPAPMAIWTYFIFTLLPVLGIVKFGQQIVADRYSYLPSMGLALGAGSAMLLLLRSSRRTVKSAGIGIGIFALLALCIQTFEQSKNWRDDLSLWEFAVAQRPGQAVPHFMLGTFLEKRGEREAAIKNYAAAVRVRPRYARGYMNRALQLNAQGNSVQAEIFFSAILNGAPDSVEAYYVLGFLSQQQNKFGEALAAYEKALSIDRRFIMAYLQIGALFLERGQLDKAERYYKLALEQEPTSAVAHNDFGVLLAHQGRLDAASVEFTEALRLNPRHKNAATNQETIRMVKGARTPATARLFLGN